MIHLMRTINSYVRELIVFKMKIENSMLFYFANCLAAIGAGIMLILAPWIAVNRTGEAFSAGLIMIVMLLPNLIGGPFIGNLIDRYDGKKMCFYMDICRFFLFIVLAIFLKTDLQIYFFYLIILFLSMFNSIFRTSSQVMIKVTFPDVEIARVNSTNLVFREVGYLFGTGIGGFLLSFYPPWSVSVLVSVLFLLSSLFLFKIKTTIFRNTVNSSDHSYLMDIRSGYLYLKNHQKILPLLYLVGFVSLGLQICPMLLSPMCKLYLNVSSKEFGLIEVAWALGSILIGTLISRKLHKKYSFILTMCFKVSLAVAFLFAYFANHWFVLLVTYFLLGFFGQVVIFHSSRIQILCEQEYIGRVFGFFNFASALVSLIVFGVISYMLTIFDVNTIYLVGFGINLIPIGITYFKRKDLFT